MVFMAMRFGRIPVSIYSIAKYSSVLMLAGLSFVSIGGAAIAQPDEITVVAPRDIEQKQVGRTRYGSPIQEISVSYEIGYKDLDLKKTADVEALNKRVTHIAKQACSEVTQLPPYGGNRQKQDCIRKSVKSAKDQINTAVAAAGK
jgi:UrcA family protein